MLLIIIVAFLAAFRFRAEAKKRGYETDKVTRYPLIVGFVLLLIAFVVSLLMRAILSAMSMPENFQEVIGFVVNLFFLMIFFAIIAKSWKAIKQLPPRPKSNEPPTTTGG